VSNYKTLDEVLEEVEKDRKTFSGRLRAKKARAKSHVRTLLYSPKNVKYWYQRITRGYSDADAWNGDTFLAQQISGILVWIVENGHGVSMSYADETMDPYAPDTEVMAEKRDKEYLYYAKIFAEYARNGTAFNEEWEKEFGGVPQEEMKTALIWLSSHFQELWD